MTKAGGWFLGLAAAGCIWAQVTSPCSCGANPPLPPQNRESRRYADTPDDMRPFSKFTAPYYENYTKLVEYNGAARDVTVVKPGEIDEVRIGFLGPLENHPDERLVLFHHCFHFIQHIRKVFADVYGDDSRWGFVGPQAVVIIC